LMRERRPRSLVRRLSVVRDVVKGVARLHRSGYCHRDLKPDNILLCARGVAKVGDLGTSRRHAGGDELSGAYHSPVGQLMYAAPEMYAGGGMNPALYVGA